MVVGSLAVPEQRLGGRNVRNWTWQRTSIAQDGWRRRRRAAPPPPRTTSLECISLTRGPRQTGRHHHTPANGLKEKEKEANTQRHATGKEKTQTRGHGRETVCSNTKHVVVANGTHKVGWQRASPRLHACVSKQSSIGPEQLRRPLKSASWNVSKLEKKIVMSLWTPLTVFDVRKSEKSGEKEVALLLPFH